MNVYVESNFILELARAQEQAGSCEGILAACEAGSARLIVPAFSLAEPYETVVRDAAARTQLKRALDAELRQISRSECHRAETKPLMNVAGLLIRASTEELRRLDVTVSTVLSLAQTIPTDVAVIARAAVLRASLDAKDAIVCASVLHHLAMSPTERSCFITRDEHFHEDEVRDLFNGTGCKLFRDFSRACDYICSQAD